MVRTVPIHQDKFSFHCRIRIHIRLRITTNSINSNSSIIKDQSLCQSLCQPQAQPQRPSLLTRLRSLVLGPVRLLFPGIWRMHLVKRMFIRPIGIPSSRSRRDFRVLIIRLRRRCRSGLGKGIPIRKFLIMRGWGCDFVDSAELFLWVLFFSWFSFFFCFPCPLLLMIVLHFSV
jgi:hypothetical protein